MRRLRPPCARPALPGILSRPAGAASHRRRPGPHSACRRAGVWAGRRYSLVAPIGCLQPFLNECAELLSAPRPAGTGVRMVAAAATAASASAPGLATLAPPPVVLPVPRPAAIFAQEAVDKAGKVGTAAAAACNWACTSDLLLPPLPLLSPLHRSVSGGLCWVWLPGAAA